MSDSSPLTDDHLRAIKQGLANLDEARAQVAKARAAGLDVVSHEQEIQELGVKLRKIATVYFPGRIA
jgi:hypothetical protein